MDIVRLLRGSLVLRIVFIALTFELIALLTQLAANLATGGTLPPPLERFKFLAWPALGVTLVVGVVLTVRERLPRNDRAEPHVFRLPPDIREFSGRESELRELTDFVAGANQPAHRAPKVVIIHGMPGTGKSALAIHFAHQMIGRYPDAQLYLDLRGGRDEPLSVSEALGLLTRWLGADATRLSLDVQDMKGVYWSKLAKRRSLVVLDHATYEAQVQELLPSSPDCLVLVTSIGPLVGRGLLGARRLELKPLEGSKSLELMAAIAGRESIEADPEAAALVARLCGHLPLALSVAAAQMRGPKGRSARDQAERLASTRDRLGELKVGDQAVRPSFDSSYRNLPARERILWRRLRLLPESLFRAPEAAALLDCDVHEAENLLQGLVDMHLLELFADGNYGFHDLVGIFADDRLEADEPIEEQRAAAERALALYLDEWLARAGCIDSQLLEIGGHRPSRAYVPLAEQLEALDRFERKRLNLVGAVLRANEIGAHAFTWQLATCFAPMFELRGYLADWTTTQEVAAGAAASGDMYAQAWAKLGLGHARWQQGMLKDASDQLETALEIARDRGWRRLEARALYMMGRVLHDSHELDKMRDALARYTRAFEIFQDEGLTQEQLTLLFYCAKAVYELGEVDQDVLARLVEGALQTLGRVPDQIWVVRSVGWLKEFMGLVHEDLGNLEQAGTYHVGSVDAFRRLGFRYGLARALRNLGRLRLRQGSKGQAAEALEESVQVFSATGYRHEAGSSLIVLGKALLDGQGIEAALERWQQALEIFIELGSKEAEEVRALIDASVAASTEE